MNFCYRKILRSLSIKYHPPLLAAIVMYASRHREWAEKTVLIHFNVRYHVTIQDEFPSKFFVAEETLEFALSFGMSLFMQFQILSTRCSVLANLTFQRFDAQMHFHVRMIMGTLTKSFHANVTLIGELFDANVYPFV